MRINDHIKALVLFFTTSLVLSIVFFTGQRSNDFYFLGDQFYRFSFHETLVNSFFLRKQESLNIFNAWSQITQFWDIIYYLIVYSIGVPFIYAEKILFFIVLFFSQVLSYIGFYNIKKLIPNKGILFPHVIAIVLFYNFNPYTLALWHGGVYNIGSGLVYTLTPLIFFYYSISIFGRTDLRNILITTLLLYIASFTFWLFAVTAFFLGIYTVLHLVFIKTPLRQFLINIGILASTYLMIASPIIFILLHELQNNVGDNNQTFSATYGNLQGGMWYQLMMRFSWAMYTIWHPRSLYSFHDYFFSTRYIIATLTLYGMILMGLLIELKNRHLQQIRNTLKTKTNPFVWIFLCILTISLFFAKGAQEPFGNIFVFMYDHVPLFNVFRTPDIRFGFLIVLSISVLLLIVSRYFKSWIFFLILIIIISIQSRHLLNGTAVRGQEIPGMFYDRSLFVPDDYEEIINKLNKKRTHSSFVLPIAPYEYGDFEISPNNHHIGQDILSKFIHHPFLYLSQSIGVSGKTFKNLQAMIDKNSFEDIKYYPIEYVLLRNDIVCPTCPKKKEIALPENFKRVMQNRTFTLYESSHHQPIVNTPNSTFRQINPIKYEVTVHEMNPNQKLQLAVSHNPNWRVFIKQKKENVSCRNGVINNKVTECPYNVSLSSLDEVWYLFQTPLFEDTHKIYHDYGNEWRIDPHLIAKQYDDRYYTKTPVGLSEVTFVIYYLPQAKYIVLFFISIALSIGYLVVIISKKIHEKIHS